jgi:hypothetical protein
MSQTQGRPSGQHAGAGVGGTGPSARARAARSTDSPSTQRRDQQAQFVEPTVTRERAVHGTRELAVLVDVASQQHAERLVVQRQGPDPATLVGHLDQPTTVGQQTSGDSLGRVGSGGARIGFEWFHADAPR